ncbi:LacI family DNA-binding transcriptional regulator [Streptomyces sp. JW3]|uniref:LacI family DNA-binding transcriptional regulator n=1 Tax=Streptomyces sp. JW3 TaxID=3456955 RepID=UPI003FA4A7EC
MRGNREGKAAAPRSADVARAAGVSQKTVSRVFNDEPYVSAEVRRRVLEAAAVLGYRRNGAARALASGRTRTLGVVALGTALYGPVSLLIGIERAARDAGYGLQVVNTLEGDPGGTAGAMESLLEQGVDGIIVSEPIDEGGAPPPVAVPVVVIGAPGGPGAMSSGGGADLMARAATEHLLDLGHTVIRHVAGPQRWFAARDRMAGWRTALTERGLTPPPVIEGDWSAASGHAAGRLLAAGEPDAEPTTAVFAANDDMAVGLVRSLTEAGLRVPDDVSVVGFDDIPLAGYTSPPLTTVRQPFDAVARDTIRRLVLAVEKPDAELPAADEPLVDLVVRSSTAPPSDRGHRTGAAPTP